MFEIQCVQQERLSRNFALQGFLVHNELVSSRICWYCRLIEMIAENTNVHKAVLSCPFINVWHCTYDQEHFIKLLYLFRVPNYDT
jgi:hypothetical protein